MKYFLAELRTYICNYWVNIIPSHFFRLLFYRRIMRFQIGQGSTVFMRTTFDCAKNFVMGKNSVINSACRIDPRGTILIGNNVSISEEVILLTADHNDLFFNEVNRNKEIVIEDNVWIGTRATILPGVKIGNGAIVAAGAVVTKNVGENSVVAGIPAVEIKKRSGSLDYSASYIRLLH